jgi:hypothetical protein
MSPQVRASIAGSIAPMAGHPVSVARILRETRDALPGLPNTDQELTAIIAEEASRLKRSVEFDQRADT